MDAVARICFVLGLLVLSFGYGLCCPQLEAATYQLRPLADLGGRCHPLLHRSRYLAFPASRGRGGGRPRRRRPGLTFIHYDGEKFVADLIDLEGRIVHQWRASEVFGENPAHVQFAADDSILAGGISLDGSLLLNFEGQLFPFGGGLVKLDKGFAGGVEACAQHASCGDRGRGWHDLGAVPELPAPRAWPSCRASSPGSMRTPS